MQNNSMYKITLDDQKWLVPLLQALKPTLSEYSFGNLFLFASTHQYEWFELQNSQQNYRYIKGVSYTGEHFWIPLFRPTAQDLVHLKAQFLYPISDEWKQSFNPQEANFSFLQSESDYLYLTESIQTYAGRALDGRRNLVHQFLDQYQTESFTISEQHLQDAQSVLDGWQNREKRASLEVEACKKALYHWNDLSLFGRITYADGIPSAITIGEQLNEDTFVLHFAKAAENKKGIYQYIYQDLALHLPKNYLYLNWEQDLGIEGLKSAKEAYKPLSQLTKWRVSPIEALKHQTSPHLEYPDR